MSIIYLSGYSATGKSTYAKTLQGYNILHLDHFIHCGIQHNGLDIDKVFQIYKTELNQELFDHGIVTQFIEGIRNYITKGSIVIEGQIKNKWLLDQIFKGYNYQTVVMVPKSVSSYRSRITQRFIDNPDNYGEMGFLKNADHDGKALQDYKTGGSKIFELIELVASQRYHKTMEYYNLFVEIGLEPKMKTF